MVKGDAVDANLNKSARIALLVILESSGHKVSTKELAQVTGAGIRSIQRDMHEAHNVNIRLAELLRRFNKPQNNLSVRDIVARLKINEYRVRKLASLMHIGEHLPNGRWLFHLSDLELFNQRNRRRGPIPEAKEIKENGR